MIQISIQRHNKEQEYDTKRLAEELENYRQTVSVIRNSLSYKIGSLIVDSFRHPGLNLLFLPFKLIKLVINSSRSLYKQKFLKDGEIPQITRNELIYANPGKEIHKFCFNPTEISSNRKESHVRLGCVVDDWLFNALSHNAECSNVPLDGWSVWLDNFRPDIVLVSSRWQLMDILNRGKEELQAGDESFDHFLSTCRVKRIDVIYWHTEDHIHVPLFSKLAGRCSHIFASDEPGYKALLDMYPKLVRCILPPAIEPAIHSPLQQESCPVGNFQFFYDGWADLIESPEILNDLLAPLRNNGLYLFESKYLLMANKLKDLPRWRGQILGCIDENQRISLLKHCAVLLMPSPSLASPLTKSRFILESIACDTAVLLSEGDNLCLGSEIMSKLKTVAIYSDNSKNYSKAAIEMLEDKNKRTRSLHVARRELYKHHTYAHRLQTMLAYTKVGKYWEEWPLVTMITPTKRPHMIKACLDKYSSQTYPNKEWIIIVNMESVDIESVKKIVEDYSDIRIEVLHQEQNIGRCLNYAIGLARGKLWLKIDDDDLYGPEYVTDMVLSWKTSGADFLGKPPAYFYLEKNDELFIRKTNSLGNRIAESVSPNFCGATLAGTVDSARKLPFSEKYRACVDSKFFESAFARSFKLHFVDPYNFIVYRSKDKNSHTWRFTSKQMDKNMNFVCKGLGKDEVYI